MGAILSKKRKQNLLFIFCLQIILSQKQRTGVFICETFYELKVFLGNVLANIFILIFPLYSYPQGRDGALYAVPSLFVYARMCYDRKQIHPDFAAEWSARCFGCGNSRYRISVPEEYAGRIIGDLTAIRAVYDVPVIQNRVFTAEARIPVAEAMDYSVRLASETAGRGVLSVRFDGYAPCLAGMEKAAKRRGPDPRDRYILTLRSAMTQGS